MGQEPGGLRLPDPARVSRVTAGSRCAVFDGARLSSGSPLPTGAPLSCPAASKCRRTGRRAGPGHAGGYRSRPPGNPCRRGIRLVPARGQPCTSRSRRGRPGSVTPRRTPPAGRQLAADSFPHGLRAGHVPLWSEHRIRRRPCSRPRNPPTGDQVRGIVRGRTARNKLSASTPSRSWGGRAGGR